MITCFVDLEPGDMLLNRTVPHSLFVLSMVRKEDGSVVITWLMLMHGRSSILRDVNYYIRDEFSKFFVLFPGRSR